MKKTTQTVIAMVIGVILMMPAMCTGETRYSGFLGDYYKDLKPGREGGFKMCWIKPGFVSGKHPKIMIDNVIFYYADDSPDKGIDGDEMKQLADSFNKELVNALKDKYPIVTEAGPGVGRLRIALTNIKKNKPALSAVTTVIPVGLGISLLRKGVTGAWSGAGTVSVEMMGLDSTTNEVIVAGVDERSAGFTERFSKFGSVEEAFKFWARRVRIFLDDIQSGAIKP